VDLRREFGRVHFQPVRAQRVLGQASRWERSGGTGGVQPGPHRERGVLVQGRPLAALPDHPPRPVRQATRQTPAPTLVDTKFEEFDAALSPDGRWLAYSSNESGQLELYVRPFPGTSTAKWQVSTAGGAEPNWTRISRELLFVSNDGTLTAVQVLPGPTFTMGTRQALFSLQPFVGGVRSWDITSDDDRFLIVQIRRGGGSEADELIVVENIFPELRKKGAP
jgi:Tol biopolymer transport system component